MGAFDRGVVEERNRAREDAARMDALADLRKQIALQIVEIADQLVELGGWELSAFEIGSWASISRPPACARNRPMATAEESTAVTRQPRRAR